MERVEQIDDVAGVVVDGGGGQIGGTAVESPKLWHQHAPAKLGQRELRLPHPGIQRKRVEEDEHPAGSGPRWRKGFEIALPSDGWHELTSALVSARSRSGRRAAPGSARTTSAQHLLG